MSYISIANKLIKDLKEKGIKAYLYHQAINSKSCYIRFDDPRMCSIRISDHRGYEKYSYKYNLRKDIKITKWSKDSKTNIWRMYVSFNETSKLIEALISRYNQIQTWTSEFKYQYNKK